MFDDMMRGILPEMLLSLLDERMQKQTDRQTVQPGNN